MARKRNIDRMKAYAEFNLSARLAILRITNAIAAAKVAEQLHSSRQPKHLDVAVTELSEAIMLLRGAADVLGPMHLFGPAKKKT